MIKNKRELLDSLIQPTFTYLGRCEKLPDRRPDGSKLVDSDVFTLDTKEKCGKDTITISNEYAYADNEWIELPDISHLNNGITDDTETFINDLRDTACKSLDVPVEMVKTRDGDFVSRAYNEIEVGYEKDRAANKIIDELCKVNGID